MWTLQIKRGGWKTVRYVEPMTEEEARSLLDAVERWNLGVFRIMRVED